MTEFDTQLRERIDRIHPEPGREALDWSDVLRRAERSRPRRRLPLAVAFAAVALLGIAATPLGGAISSGVGDFSAWLRGEPGTPASPEDQTAFQQANARTYAGFPEDTRLRSLIETTVGGNRFELLGFRTGGSLCLRLVLRGAGEPQTGCVPARELGRADAAAMVVLADASYGSQDVPPTEEGYVPALASATFGIAADGVREVELVDDAGRHRAELGGNAFLHVTDRPRLGLRTRSASVVGSDGVRIRVALAEAPFGNWGGPPAKPGVPPGPTGVERTVEGGRVGWVDRREERGEEPPANARFLRIADGRFEFARVLTPDASSYKRILFGVGTLPRFASRPERPSFCVSLISGGGAGGGCNDLANPFLNGPIMASLSQFGGGDQFATIAGAVADEVARLELYVASGARVAVPLRDNAFLVEAPRAEFPMRLVAYDSAGLVIGNQAYESDPVARTGARPVGPWRLLAESRAENGDVARLRLARSSEGGTCYSLLISGGAGGNGCHPKGDAGRPLELAVSSTEGSSFLYGRVRRDIASVELRLRGRDPIRAEAKEGYVLAAVPAGTVLTEVAGLDARGNAVGRQRFDQGRR